MPLLQLQDITASYGTQRVLGPISLQIRSGECVALVGQSGAGKSTLLGILYERMRADAAFMPQELGLVQSLSVFHNVFMGQLANHPPWYNVANLIRPFRREIAVIESLLQRLSIADKIWTPVGELSGGQKQRTAVARSLHQCAQILLADEPVSALDGPQAERVMDCLTERYPTAIIAMHDVELALRYAHRIIGIRQGEVVLDEPGAGLKPQDLLFLY
jgi:phosphonate transport system ATP-binding protein